MMRRRMHRLTDCKRRWCCRRLVHRSIVPQLRARRHFREIVEIGWGERVMGVFARSDTSVLGRWWWTVDRWTLTAVGALIAFGVIAALATSRPSQSHRSVISISRGASLFISRSFRPDDRRIAALSHRVFRAAMVTLQYFLCLLSRRSSWGPKSKERDAGLVSARSPSSRRVPKPPSRW